jgi:hypothetical protein
VEDPEAKRCPARLFIVLDLAVRGMLLGRGALLETKAGAIWRAVSILKEVARSVCLRNGSFSRGEFQDTQLIIIAHLTL